MTTPLCTNPDCVGIPAGANCPHNPVQCYGGVLVVADQSTWTRRFAANAAPAIPIPSLSPGQANGPLNDDLTNKLIVSIHNPYCAEASILAHFEFGCGFAVSDTDHWSVNGDVAISGAGCVFTSYGPPGFATPTDFTTLQVTLHERDGTALINSNTIIGWAEQHTYTLEGKIPAGGTATLQALTRFEYINVRGTGRSIGNFQVALTVNLNVRRDASIV